MRPVGNVHFTIEKHSELIFISCKTSYSVIAVCPPQTETHLSIILFSFLAIGKLIIPVEFEKCPTAMAVYSILKEFGLEGDEIHIINGHVPVKAKKGESPIKCNGKVLVIDGGFSKAYQSQTGIAGYTLIYNSYGLLLVAHEPFESAEAAVQKESDIHSERTVVERAVKRKLVADTDNGKHIKEQIEDLKVLLEAYRSGKISQRL